VSSLRDDHNAHLPLLKLAANGMESLAAQFSLIPEQLAERTLVEEASRAHWQKRIFFDRSS
jgi:hypothetical protein